MDKVRDMVNGTDRCIFCSCIVFFLIIVIHMDFFSVPDEEDCSEISGSSHRNAQFINGFGELLDEPVSLPALDVSNDRISFQHNDPTYHSINVPRVCVID